MGKKKSSEVCCCVNPEVLGLDFVSWRATSKLLMFKLHVTYERAARARKPQLGNPRSKAGPNGKLILKLLIFLLKSYGEGEGISRRKFSPFFQLALSLEACILEVEPFSP